MPESISLWGEEFELPEEKEKTKKVINKIKKPKEVKVTVEKQIKSKTLSLQERLKIITENVLKAAFEEYSPLSVHAIITRPNTGEILALVNYPFFDSNHYNKYPIEALKNKNPWFLRFPSLNPLCTSARTLFPGKAKILFDTSPGLW